MNRIVLSIALSALAVAAAEAKPRVTRTERTQSAEQTVSGHDGAWVIEAATTVGSCDGLVPQAITIRDSKVAEAGGGVSPWGYVEGDGTFVARFTNQSGQLARAQGKLSGHGGSGAWSSSTAMCGGTWRAARVGAERAAQ